MVAQRTHDTEPERILRSELHRRGLRYRVHVRPLPNLRRQADVVFSREKIAVFVDGCFWHGCAEHRGSPKSNTGWWRTKIQENRARDADTDRRLLEAGWMVIRIWEHEAVDMAAARVADAAAKRRQI
jgi:DNA mismatch endonuclease, patch repair protein